MANRVESDEIFFVSPAWFESQPEAFVVFSTFMPETLMAQGGR